MAAHLEEACASLVQAVSCLSNTSHFSTGTLGPESDTKVLKLVNLTQTNTIDMDLTLAVYEHDLGFVVSCVNGETVASAKTRNLINQLLQCRYSRCEDGDIISIQGELDYEKSDGETLRRGVVLR